MMIFKSKKYGKDLRFELLIKCEIKGVIFIFKFWCFNEGGGGMLIIFLI